MMYSRILPAFASMAVAAAHFGDLTHYEPSATKGSCGWQNKPIELVVALSNETMGNGANADKNPKCGKEIEIFNPTNSKSVKAIIVDTCTSCTAGSIAGTDAVASALSQNNDGQVLHIQWSGTNLLNLDNRHYHKDVASKKHKGAAKAPSSDVLMITDDSERPMGLLEAEHVPFLSPRLHPRQFLKSNHGIISKEPTPALNRRQVVIPDDPLCPWWWKPCDW